MSTPKFERPPLVEVLCGVSFDRAPNIQEPQLAALWHALFGDYPRMEVNAPLPPLDIPGQPNEVIHATRRTPVARHLYLNSNGEWLLQVQQNRMLVNWRRQQGGTYPGFGKLLRRFHRETEKVTKFMEARQIGLRLRGYEVEYFGHIPIGTAPVVELADLRRVLPWIAWPGTAHVAPLDSFIWESTSRPASLPGLLRVQVRTVMSPVTGGPAVAMDIHARGKPDAETVDEWFGAAHDCCVRAFCELTSEDVQRDVWQIREPEDG